MEGQDLHQFDPLEFSIKFMSALCFILLVVFFCVQRSYSFEPDGNSYSRKEYEARQRTLRKSHPIRVQQPVVVDRYDVRKLQNDPAVLVSVPTPKPQVQVVEKIIYVERKPATATISAEWEE